MKQITTPFKPEEYEGKKVLALTGAGISVASGIPCYWGENGSYQKLQEKFGAPIDEVLSSQNMKNNPKQVWAYMKELFDGLTDVKPNPAHIKLAELEKVASEFHLVTQNCDTLHSQAGSVNVHEVHGTAANALCTGCGELEPDYVKQLEHVAIPRCTGCGSNLRPNVVLFNEFPRMDSLKLTDFALRADILIVIGTQAYFTYITELMNSFATTGGTSVWVDVTEPTDLMGNWMVNPSLTNNLNYYTKGAVDFFSEMFPEL